jgi:hypothetical protein
MSKKRLPSVSRVETVWVVREGKECFHAGIEYRSGDVFPFDDISLEQQNLHLPNLERREAFPLDNDPLINEAFTHTSPETVIEVLTQEQAEDGDRL